MGTRANWPITDHLPMTEHFGRSFSNFSSNFSPFSVIWNIIRTPSQVVQIIFEMQSQRTNQKKSSKKNTFIQLQNVFFFHFFSFWLLLLLNLIIFLFFIHFKQFCNRNTTSNFTNHLWCPLLWGAITFSIVFFFMIFNALHAQIREVQVLFGHQKQQSPPLGSSLP